MPMSHTSVKQTRRERGKLAQREYRKRHASTFQSLKEENQSLKDSIRHLTAVAATIHPRQLNPDLGVAIDRLRDIAGLADQYGPVAPAAAAAAAAAAAVSVTSADTSHLDMLFPVSDSSGGMVSPSSSGPAVLPTSVALGSDPLGTMTGTAMHDPSLGFQISLDQQQQQQHHHHHQPHHPHNVHHHSHHHQTLPPLPPPPPPAYEPPSYEPMFFGQDMFTFAGRLFWDCLTYNVVRTQRLQNGTVTRNEQNPGGTFTMGDEDQEMIAAMARTRLQYREPLPDYIMPGQTGAYPAAHHLQHHQHQHHQTHNHHYTQQHHHHMGVAQRNPNAFPVQVDTVENYYFGRCAKVGGGGGPAAVASDLANLSAWWKTPTAVEAFVRERLSLDEFRSLEDSIAGRDMGNLSESKVRMAMHALVANAIYFPDGPRWNVMYLAIVVGSWVRGFKGGDMNIPG